MSNDLIILDGIIEENKSKVASEMSESRFFELIVAEQSTKRYDLNYDQLLHGLVGGGSDGGVDAFYVFVDDSLMEEDTEAPASRNGIQIHLVIVQATRKQGFGESALDKLHSFAEVAFDFAVDPTTVASIYNESLVERIELFRLLYKRYARKNPKVQITFFYGTRGTEKVHPNVIHKRDRLIIAVNSLFSSEVSEFTFLGASELLRLVRQRRKSNFELRLAENPITPANNSVNLIGLVSLSDYFEFITNDNYRLRQNIFEANVRDYQTTSAINRQILETLKGTHDDDFWWLNNGITILSTHVGMSFNSKILNIDNPEIVNGLQTSQEVFNYFSQRMQAGDKNLQDDRNLLVRVIVCDQESSRNRIILATNSQNKISIDALKAHEEIQRNIEDHLRRCNIYYDRRRNYWKLRRKPISRIFTPMKLGQAVQSILLYDPKTAKEKPSLAFKKGNEERYGAIFSKAYDIDLYKFSAELLIRVETILKSDLIKTNLDQRAIGQIRFHALTHITIRATCTLEVSPGKVAKLKQHDISDDMLLESATRVLEIFEPMGANNITSKSSRFLNAVVDDAKSMIVVP